MINKMAYGSVDERKFFDTMMQHSPFLQQIWRKPYRLVEINHGRLGIYSEGGDYIVDPADTLLFNDEVLKIYEQI